MQKLQTVTANMLEEPAMTKAQLMSCFKKAEKTVKELHQEGL